MIDQKETCAKCRDGEIEPRHCEYYGEPNGCNSPTYGEHPPAGNAAAMREALVEIRDAINKWYDDDYISHGVFSVLWDLCSDALSEPARNCDIYKTIEKAGKALEDYCAKKSDTGECVLSCKHSSAKGGCAISWLLAPAEEGGAE